MLVLIRKGTRWFAVSVLCIDVVSAAAHWFLHLWAPFIAGDYLSGCLGDARLVLSRPHNAPCGSCLKLCMSSDPCTKPSVFQSFYVQRCSRCNSRSDMDAWASASKEVDTAFRLCSSFINCCCIPYAGRRQRQSPEASFPWHRRGGGPSVSTSFGRHDHRSRAYRMYMKPCVCLGGNLLRQLRRWVLALIGCISTYACA